MSTIDNWLLFLVSVHAVPIIILDLLINMKLYRSALFLEIAAIAVLSCTGMASANRLPWMSDDRFASTMHRQAEPDYYFGTCTESEFNETLAELDSQVDFQGYCLISVETICQDECLDIIFQLAVLCNGDFIAKTYRAYCGQYDGKSCLELFLTAEDEYATAFESANISCSGASTTTCLPDCKSSLQQISATLGCCLNNIYNNSELGLEYETLNSYELWKECGVETPGFCLYGDGPDDYDYEYFGACTESEFNETLAELDSQVDLQGYCLSETICQDECLDILFQLTVLCDADEIAKTYRAYCGRYDGKSCLELFTTSEDEFSTSFESATISCSGATTSACSPDCKSSLQQISATAGCCLNNIYNNSELGLGFEYETLISYELWKECGVETPGFCLYEDGPDDYEYDYFGACTESEFNETLAELNSQVDFQGYCLSETICQDECLDILFQLTVLCDADEIAKTYRAYCGRYDGKSCLELFTTSEDEFSTSFESATTSCSGTTTTTCLLDCKLSLQQLSATAGCCLNNIYNNSELELGLDNEEDTPYNTLFNYELWKVCGVETPGLCLYGTGVGAVMKGTHVLVMAVALAVLSLCYNST